MLNAAIVGLGRWGQRLVDSVQGEGVEASPLIRFRKGYARTPSRVQDYADKRGITLAASFEDLLADRAVDAIVLATPHSQHVGQVLQCAAIRRPVFVEKPLALNLVDALRVRKACDDAGIVLALGHNRRFFPAMQEMRRLARTGALGTLLHVEGNFSGSFGLDYDSSVWRASEKEAPGGGLTLMGVHILDAMIDLLGPISAVAATSLRQVLRIELDDTSACAIGFAGGQSGYMSTLTATARLWRMQLFGTGGWAHVLDHEILEVGLTGQPVRRMTWPAVDAERHVMEAFAHAVAGTAAYPVPLDDVINGIAAMDAFVSSARAGGAVVALAEAGA